jgi:hypothetical protein
MTIDWRIEKIETYNGNRDWLDRLAESHPPLAAQIEQICDLAGTSDADWQVLEAAGRLLLEKTIALQRCKTLCENLTLENKGFFRRLFSRWRISDEPLRGDAASILEDIHKALR